MSGLKFSIRGLLSFCSIAVFALSLTASAVNGAHNPRLTRRDTLRQKDPRRYAIKPYDERNRTPKNYRPTLGRSRYFNGTYRYSSHYQTTNKAFYTNSGRRVVENRAGRLSINSNRTQVIRRRAFRPRW